MHSALSRLTLGLLSTACLIATHGIVGLTDTAAEDIAGCRTRDWREEFRNAFSFSQKSPRRFQTESLERSNAGQTLNALHGDDSLSLEDAETSFVEVEEDALGLALASRR